MEMKHSWIYWYLVLLCVLSALYLAVCASDFDYQQNCFHPLELVLTSAG